MFYAVCLHGVNIKIRQEDKIALIRNIYHKMPHFTKEKPHG